ncbi:MAG: extracellular solute-binding protein [Gammaproteobacteria bacterium]|nr:extracellular solute-binding protein [Gammaproteobacteria bacterium]
MLLLLCPVVATPAAGQAERALDAVRHLIASGDVAPDTVLRLAFKQGNVNAYLGNDLALQRLWERETGIVIETRIIPQLPAQQVIASTDGIDLTVARNHEFPELLPLGLIEDLTPLFEEFAFPLDGGPPDGYIRPDLQAYLGDRIAAIPADGDPVIMYLRRDLLDDPEERAAFRAATGRELDVPQTWAEYETLYRFFHRPEQGLFGVVEERDPEGAWMYWLPRYLSMAKPYQPLFDAQMRPLLDTPQGIAATESYLATVAHGPPGITDDGNNYSFTLPLYLQGKVFAMLHTPSASKLLGSPASRVQGRVLFAPVPGTRIDGELVRRNTIIYGNNLVVPAKAPNPKLAFLYAMWITSPEVSPRSVGVRGGFTDPYRWDHLRDPRITEIYGAQALEAFAASWPDTLPPGTGIPGDSEYLEVLNRNLTAAARGEFDAAEAMRRTARTWDAITERHGRAAQVRHWKTFQSNFRVGG